MEEKPDAMVHGVRKSQAQPNDGTTTAKPFNLSTQTFLNSTKEDTSRRRKRILTCPLFENKLYFCEPFFKWQ